MLQWIICILLLQGPFLLGQQPQGCDCEGPPSFILMEDDLYVYDIPCMLPDTLVFHSERLGIERRYIFLDCKGAVMYQKLSRDGDILTQGQFVPTDSIVKMGLELLFEDEEHSGLGDTVEYEEAFYARKIGIWIYR